MLSLVYEGPPRADGCFSSIKDNNSGKELSAAYHFTVDLQLWSFVQLIVKASLSKTVKAHRCAMLLPHCNCVQRFLCRMCWKQMNEQGNFQFVLLVRPISPTRVTTQGWNLDSRWESDGSHVSLDDF